MSNNVAGTTSGRTNTRPLFRYGDLIVRPASLGDAVAIMRAANFTSVTRMTATLPYPYRRRHAVAWIRDCQRQHRRARSDERHYLIVRRGQVVGAIGATRHGDEAHLGYWLTPAVWGRGIMTAVVRRFVPLVWRWWPIARIAGRVFRSNPASARVLVKSGFRRAAIELRAVRKGRRWVDVEVYLRHRGRR